jgi:periplasmic protein TonB
MKITLFITALLLLTAANAQKNKKKEDQFFLFDTAWKAASARKAAYIARVQHIDDTTWQWNYYNVSGPLINIESFRDEKADIPNGYCAWFDTKGRIDSAGSSINGRKHGDWFYFNDEMAITMVDQYNNGKFIQQISGKDFNKRPESLPGDSDATMEGGTATWKKYLEKNYRFPERSLKNRIGGTTLVSFAIDTTGEVNQVRLMKSAELSIDMEVLRLIGASPRWIPAVKNGQKVVAYRRQPFTAIATGN